MKPCPDKPPGFYVEAIAADGEVLTNVPPDFCVDLGAALSWFMGEIEDAKNAPPDWCAARIKEVRLTWTKETDEARAL